MSKYFIFAVTCFLFYSCNSKNKRHTYELYPSDQKIVIPIADTIDCFSTCIKHYTDGFGHNFIAYLDDRTNSILFFSVDSSKLSHIVNIELKGPNGIGKVGGYKIIDLDSIIICNKQTNLQKLYIVNKKGLIKKVLNISDNPANRKPFWVAPPLSSLSMDYVLLKNKIILNSVFYYQPRTQNDFEDNKLSAVYDLINDTLLVNPVSYPNLLVNNKVYSPFYSVATDRSQFVYSFCGSDKLFVTNDHVSLIEYEARSNYYGNKKIPVNEHHNMKKHVESSRYSSIYYDFSNRLYYRFFIIGKGLNKDDNLMSISRYPTQFSIIIINTDFEVVGETLLPENEYNPRMSFMTEEGLYISSNHIESDEFDENKIKFRLFKIRRNEK